MAEKSEWVLALDIGTSSLKALAMAADGRVLGHAESAYAVEHPQPPWAEQAPEIWWNAASIATRDLLGRTQLSANALRGIGLSGQMHGTVLLAADEQPLRSAIIWADGRSVAEITTLDSLIPRSEIVRISGNTPNTGFMALSLLWLQKHERQLWQQVRHVLLPKDYLGLRLTGNYATDVSDAAGTLLFDVSARTWSQVLCDACSVPSVLLPPVYESQTVIGSLLPGAAADLGLLPGVPVTVGGGDSPCAALAQGVTEPQTLGCTIGTAAQLVWPTTTPRLDSAGRVHSLCHVLPQRWYLMGAILSGGASLAWLASLWPGTPIETLLAEAESIPPGAHGLLFLPYLNGERSPHMDANARGVFFGLTSVHGRAHMVRAVLEGVAFALNDSLSIFRELGLTGLDPQPVVRLSGGAARSVLWSQILADVFGLSVAVADNTHGSAQGAGLLAGVAAGFWPSPAISAAQLTHTYAPDTARVERYAMLYGIYHSLYPALRKNLSDLAHLR